MIYFANILFLIKILYVIVLFCNLSTTYRLLCTHKLSPAKTFSKIASFLFCILQSNWSTHTTTWIYLNYGSFYLCFLTIITQSLLEILCRIIHRPTHGLCCRSHQIFDSRERCQCRTWSWGLRCNVKCGSPTET